VADYDNYWGFTSSAGAMADRGPPSTKADDGSMAEKYRESREGETSSSGEEHMESLQIARLDSFLSEPHSTVGQGGQRTSTEISSQSKAALSAFDSAFGESNIPGRAKGGESSQAQGAGRGNGVGNEAGKTKADPPPVKPSKF
jgi:hypothetical protein